MRKILLLITLLTLFLSSCSNLKSIEATDAEVESFKLVSVSKAQVVLNVEIDNPSGKTFTIKSLDGELLKDGTVFADVVLLNQPVVPGRAITKVPVNLEITLKDPLAALAMGLNYKSLDISQFAVNATAVVKGGGLKPKIELENVPAKNIVQYFK